jgi:hypothetical protein
MRCNKKHRERLYQIIEDRWQELDTRVWEAWLEEIGIEWAELDDEIRDAPKDTVAIWEGPGHENKKMCWVVPNDTAMKLLVLGVP